MAQCKQHTTNENERDRQFHGKVKRFLQGLLVFTLTVLVTSATILAIHAVYKDVVLNERVTEGVIYGVHPVDKNDVYGRDCVIITSNKAAFLVCDYREL
ncbi:hypothetical protein [Vibrio phage CAU_VPP01]|nr:hypothetical protein [Vibrio phage CAU_VPP01]